MPKSSYNSNAILKLYFNGTPIANIADNAAASPLTKLYVALHTQDPTVGGAQSLNEVAYTGYARVAVNRDGTGWTVTGNVVSPAANVEFGEMTGGTAGTATHMSIGTSATGAGQVLWYGAISPAVNYNVGVVPRLRTTTTITET